MKKNDGFTLIELLAVVVILAVVALISTPIILNIIDDAQKGAFKNTAYGIIQASKYSYTDSIIDSGNIRSLSFSYIDGVELSHPVGKKLDYKGTRPKSGSVIINGEGEITIAIYNGKYCAEKDFDDVAATITTKTEEECLATLVSDTSGASAPELTDNMIPIKWDGTKWVKAATNNLLGAVQWYDYTNKKWANVALVSEGERETYISAPVGTEIQESHVMAYLVWVPRYRYKLFNVGATAVSPLEIDIVFENKTIGKSAGTTNTTYLTHPAFTFGDKELNGIWVGKFETTGNVTTPTIKPNTVALVNQTAHDQFLTAQKFNTTTTYGLTATNDTHMMKNTEWGAVAYLSRSIYGKNSEVWINPNSAYKTGCAGDGASVVATTACQTYETANGVQASTTGNIYGIYDMSGGAYEMTMAAPYDAATNINLYLNASTGFTAASIITDAFIKDVSNARYIDKYNYGTTYNDQTAYNRRILGDATGEVRGWYSDYSRMNYYYSSRSWAVRGYTQSGTVSAGIFGFSYTSGGAGTSVSFRTVVIN